MTGENEPSKPPARGFPAQVIHVEAYEKKLVINRGSEDGVKVGSRFLVYALSKEELLDPETNESLGYLETVRGRGVATHVQPRMSTLEPEIVQSNTRRVIRRTPNFVTMLGGQEEEVITEKETEQTRFEDPAKGDRVKPI